MLDYNMENASINFVKTIKETDVYKKYHFQLEKLKKHPDYYEKVNEFRQRNYEIQNASKVDDMFDKLDAFEKEYEKFREDPLVDDFLRAELAFCRMMQEINTFITQKLDFE